mmetsp:Transcript_4793/g.7376  ORF Transcript_4793/g.7376 Transcript_4793/m.7376 type:complete len:180 (-) Transcript_4793:257-796(-)
MEAQGANKPSRSSCGGPMQGISLQVVLLETSRRKTCYPAIGKQPGFLRVDITILERPGWKNESGIFCSKQTGFFTIKSPQQKTAWSFWFRQGSPTLIKISTMIYVDIDIHGVEDLGVEPDGDPDSLVKRPSTFCRGVRSISYTMFRKECTSEVLLPFTIWRLDLPPNKPFPEKTMCSKR